jgi:hypothetical protein
MKDNFLKNFLASMMAFFGAGLWLMFIVYCFNYFLGVRNVDFNKALFGPVIGFIMIALYLKITKVSVKEFLIWAGLFIGCSLGFVALMLLFKNFSQSGDLNNYRIITGLIAAFVMITPYLIINKRK